MELKKLNMHEVLRACPSRAVSRRETPKRVLMQRTGNLPYKHIGDYPECFSFKCHLHFKTQSLVSPPMLTGNDLETEEAGRLSFRAPCALDGPELYALVKRCKPLDVNSRYCYIILCEHFSSTCVVAEKNKKVIGFITAYIPPERRDTLFVWQVAVDNHMRGQGVAKQMLRNLLSRRNLKRIHFIEATVNPSNNASRSLFTSLSNAANCLIDEDLIFPATMFGDGAHEQENLIRVGPINSVGKTLIGE